MSNTPKAIRLPSADGHGELDRHVLLPPGADVEKSLKAINDTIHAVNLEDHENDGECLDGESVEENIERRLTALGFTVIETVETANCWDEFDGNYNAEEPARHTVHPAG